MVKGWGMVPSQEEGQSPESLIRGVRVLSFAHCCWEKHLFVTAVDRPRAQ